MLFIILDVHQTQNFFLINCIFFSAQPSSVWQFGQCEEKWRNRDPSPNSYVSACRQMFKVSWLFITWLSMWKYTLLINILISELCNFSISSGQVGVNSKNFEKSSGYKKYFIERQLRSCEVYFGSASSIIFTLYWKVIITIIIIIITFIENHAQQTWSLTNGNYS